MTRKQSQILLQRNDTTASSVQVQCNRRAGEHNQSRKGRRKTGDTDAGVFRPGNGRVLFAAEGWQAGRL